MLAGLPTVFFMSCRWQHVEVVGCIWCACAGMACAWREKAKVGEDRNRSRAFGGASENDAPSDRILIIHAVLGRTTHFSEASYKGTVIDSTLLVCHSSPPLVDHYLTRRYICHIAARPTQT